MKAYDFILLLKQHLAVTDEKKLNIKLYRAFKYSIESIQAIEDYKCPSTRFLSERLGYSRDTVEKSYQLLEQEGLIYRIKGKGSFVRCSLQPDHIPITEQVLSDTQYQLAVNTDKLSALFFDQNLNFFADGMPEIRNFPFKKWFEVEKQVLSEFGLSIFLKDNSAGDALLRKEIATLTNLYRHAQIQAEQVLIVNSTQQALYLCTQVLFNPNDQIVMENPFYPNAKRLFEMAKLNIHHALLDDEGLDIKSCEGLEEIKALYLTPANQYPSSMAMTLSRKQQIIAFAQQHNSYIIEDDYDALMLSQYRNPAILALDQGQRTIYLGSFSKYILPSLRMSYLILPLALVEPFKRYRNYIDGSAPSQYSQVMLAKFMQKGFYAIYLSHMQQIYAQRYQTFKDNYHYYLGDYCELKEYQPSMQVACYFKATLPHALEQALVDSAMLREIYLTRLSQFYADQRNAAYGFVLGFSALSHSEIIVCLQKLKQLIVQELLRIQSKN